MMRIFFLSGFGQGGAERQVIETSRALAENSIEVTIITFSIDNCFYDFPERVKVLQLDKRTGINQYLPKWLRKVSALFRMRKVIRKEKPDYVISYITKLNSSLGIVGLTMPLRNTVFLASERTTELRYISSRKWRWICRVAYKGIDGFFTNNTVTKGRITTYLGTSPIRIKILRNIIDTDAFAPDLSRKEDLFQYAPGVPFENLSILVPGRIDAQKNQKVLVDVCKILKKKGIVNIHFFLAGNNSSKYAFELEEEIKQANLDKQFTLLGQIRDMAKLYRAADIILLPSLIEGFPNALLESMACGTISITTNVSDVEQIIEDGEEALITREITAEEIALKVTDAMQMTEAQKDRMKKAARRKALQFGKEEYLKSLFEILSFFDRKDTKLGRD